MEYVIYALWIIALVIALRFGFSLYYQWRYKDIVKSNPQTQRKLLIRHASPLVMVMMLSFALQYQPINNPNIANYDFYKAYKILSPSTENTDYEDAMGIRSSTDAQVSGYVMIEEEGKQVKYFVLTIRGENYLIKDPDEN
jgi:hypothetical protein